MFCRPVSDEMRFQVELSNDLGNRVTVHDSSAGAAGSPRFLLGVPETPSQRVGDDAHQWAQAQVSCLCLSTNHLSFFLSLRLIRAVHQGGEGPQDLCAHA